MATGNKKKHLVLLWENPRKGSSFDPTDPILVDLSGYQFIFLVAAVASGTDTMTSGFFPINGATCTLQWVSGLSNSTMYAYLRTFTATTTGVQFANAYRHSFSGTSAPSANNAYCIPYYIYGVRDWIFGEHEGMI